MPSPIQGVVDSIDTELEVVYSTMEPMFTSAVGMGQTIGGFGAVMYVFYRIWDQWSRAEPINPYPLLRPFALGILLICYLPFVGFIKSIYTAIDSGSRQQLIDKVAQADDLREDIEQYRLRAIYYSLFNRQYQGSEKLTWGDLYAETAMQNPLDFEALGNKFSYMGESIKESMASIVMTIFEVIYATARVALKTLSVFFQIILFILGPLVIGLACYDWFYGSLPAYMARLINIMLWGPIANMVSTMLVSIEISLLNRTKAAYQAATAAGETASGFTSNDFSMMVFMLLGTICFFMIPMISSWIIQSCTSAASSAVMQSANAAGSTVAGGAGAVVGQGAAAVSNLGRSRI